MGYIHCLELAGAVIICQESFGDYQGTWLAKVIYNGETGWVYGSYGSCSGCDSYEGEFSSFQCSIHPERYGHYKFEDTCEEYRQKQIEFGRSYLDPLWSQERMEEYASSNLHWDLEAKEFYDFVVANR